MPLQRSTPMQLCGTELPLCAFVSLSCCFSGALPVLYRCVSGALVARKCALNELSQPALNYVTCQFLCTAAARGLRRLLFGHRLDVWDVSPCTRGCFSQELALISKVCMHIHIHSHQAREPPSPTRVFLELSYGCQQYFPPMDIISPRMAPASFWTEPLPAIADQDADDWVIVQRRMHSGPCASGQVKRTPCGPLDPFLGANAAKSSTARVPLASYLAR